MRYHAAMRSVREIPVLEGIPVLLRTSLNAPMKEGKVENTFRLQSALPTIKYLAERHAKVVLISHVSGTGTETLRPVYEAMKRLVPNLSWCPVSAGKDARAMVRSMLPGGVLMLENLRRNKGEEANDPEFAKELAMLADVFVQDSFDVCHREHASVVGVPALLPSYAGFTLEAEVRALDGALEPERPSLAVIAGAKFSTKEPVLKKLLSSYDHVFVGGALANDFIQAKGYSVGASLVSKEGADRIEALLKNKKLVVPVDAIVAKKGEARSHARGSMLADIQGDEMILDAGPHTAAALMQLAQKAKTVLWNGPLGRFEDGFIDATALFAKAVAESKAHSILGGGDTVSAVEQIGLAERFAFVSTGGGAMLDYLAYGTLPGIEALQS